jgi:hypothetical protein
LIDNEHLTVCFLAVSVCDLLVRGHLRRMSGMLGYIGRDRFDVLKGYLECNLLFLETAKGVGRVDAGQGMVGAGVGMGRRSSEIQGGR